MPYPTTPIASRARIATALAMGTTGVLMVGVQPILLGALVDAGQISLEGVGLVAMAEIITLGLGVLLGDALLSIARLRAWAFLAALAVAGLDGLSVWAQSDAAMMGLRASAGLAEGVLVWGATGVVVRTAAPSRWAGVFFVVQTLAQALLGAVLAHAVIPRWGWQGGFVVLGGVVALSALLAPGLPAGLQPLVKASIDETAERVRLTLWPLVVVFLQMAALGAYWAYMEPLGKVAGLDAQAAQSLIAAVLVAQVIGGSLATLVTHRWSVQPTLLACSALLAMSIGSIAGLAGQSASGFLLASLLFGAVWLFMLPFHIQLAMRADSTGRMAAQVPAAQLLGSAFGPLTASFMVQGDDAGAVPWLGVAYAVLAACWLWGFRKRLG